MEDGLTVEMIGSRIAAVAHMAMAMHLAMDQSETGSSSQLQSVQQAMVGGTDRRVTDDPLSAVVGRE